MRWSRQQGLPRSNGARSKGFSKDSPGLTRQEDRTESRHKARIGVWGIAIGTRAPGSGSRHLGIAGGKDFTGLGKGLGTGAAHKIARLRT
jgi:hypothetical protein